jgi:hypothetical protein
VSSPPVSDGAPRRSRLAVAGLVCALLGIIPLAWVLWAVFAGTPTRGELAAGQCFNFVRDTDTIEDMSLRPCDQPHRGEVTGSIELPAGMTFRESDFQATLACTDQLRRYLRSPKPLIAVQYVGPSGSEWADGDRHIVCLGLTKSETTHSLRD